MPDGEVRDVKLYVMMDGEVIGELPCDGIEMPAPDFDVAFIDPHDFEPIMASIEMTAKSARQFVRTVMGLDAWWRKKVARVKEVHRRKRGRLKR